MNSALTFRSLFSIFRRPLGASDVPRLVALALLVLEFVLLLQDHFRATAFKAVGLGPPGPEGKGWAVLYALATAAAAVVLLLIWFLVAMAFRLPSQFSIRWLLFFALIVAIPCCWFAAARRQAKRQREIVDTIRRMGGRAKYDYETIALMWREDASPPPPTYWRRLLGDDFFDDVFLVNFWSDVDLRCLEGLGNLRNLALAKATDEGLEPVERLTTLEILFLSETNVTNAGLVHLKGLTNLTFLSLPPRVTDAGLEHLKGLSRLEELIVTHTHVTEKGARNLHEAIPACKIIWGYDRHVP